MTKVSNLNPEPLISIIVPVYNVENFLDRCIKSIINQTYQNLEIILVDDGSTDSCPSICDSWKEKDKRIKVIHQKNGGLSAARNSGIIIAKGEYLSFIDSDDYVDSTYISSLVNLIQEADIAITSHRVIYSKTTFNVLNAKTKTILKKELAIKKLLYGNIDASAWGKLYKKELFKNIRFPEGKLFEDIATTPLLIDAAKKISISPEITYNYIMNSESISKKKTADRKDELIKMTDSVCDYLASKYSHLQSAIARRKMFARLSTLSQYAVVPNVSKNLTTPLVQYVRKHSSGVLKDPLTPKRDKFGIICATLGFGFYKFSWNISQLVSRKK